MVPLTGIEPVRILLRGILSPLCLPISPQRQILDELIQNIFLVCLTRFELTTYGLKVRCSTNWATSTYWKQPLLLFSSINYRPCRPWGRSKVSGRLTDPQCLDMSEQLFRFHHSCSVGITPHGREVVIRYELIYNTAFNTGPSKTRWSSSGVRTQLYFVNHNKLGWKRFEWFTI